MNGMMARLAAFLIVCSLGSTGCLSLGGRTTYVQESEETQNRISALEKRMARLEGLMTPEPMPYAMPTELGP